MVCCVYPRPYPHSSFPSLTNIEMTSKMVKSDDGSEDEQHNVVASLSLDSRYRHSFFILPLHATAPITFIPDPFLNI